MKKNTSIIIVLVIATAIITVTSAWMKITNKEYADDALTVAVILEIAIVVGGVIWLFIEQKRRKATL